MTMGWPEWIYDAEEPKESRIDRHYLRSATLLALDRSKDPSTKVGAIIVAPDGRKISGGYNGFVRGAPESDEVWLDRPSKYKRVLHAEKNAILNCPFPTEGATLYCTLHPCIECLKDIIQAGIARIVYYGKPCERWEIDPEVFAELSPMVAWTPIDGDYVIEMLRKLYTESPAEI